MKKLVKILAIVLAIATLGTVLCFSLVACNKDKQEVITVGYTVFEPMNYFDADGNLIGFDTDLAKKVFESLGYKVQFKEIQWENKYLDLESGSIDCIWNGFTSNSSDDGQARNTLVDFSYQYMQNFQAVVVQKSAASTYTNMATSFASKRGAVETKSAGDERLADFTGSIKKDCTSQMVALQDLAGNGSDFAIVDYLLANSIVGKGNFANLQILTQFNSDAEYYAIGFKKGSALRDKVNGKLAEFLSDGSLLKLAEKYNLDNALIKDYSKQNY